MGSTSIFRIGLFLFLLLSFFEKLFVSYNDYIRIETVKQSPIYAENVDYSLQECWVFLKQINRDTKAYHFICQVKAKFTVENEIINVKRKVTQRALSEEQRILFQTDYEYYNKELQSLTSILFNSNDPNINCLYIETLKDHKSLVKLNLIHVALLIIVLIICIYLKE